MEAGMLTEGGTATRAEEPSQPAARSRWSLSELVLLLVLAAVQFTLIIDFVIVMPLGPAVKNALTLTNQQFGWMVSAYGFTASVTGLLAASLLDRFDRKKSLLVLFAGFTTGTLLCGLAPTFPVLVLGRAVAGGFAGVMGANVLAIVGDVFPESRRATAMGVIMSSFSVASIVGIPAGIFLANHSGWQAPFLVLGLMCLPALLLAARVLPPLRGHLERRRDPVRLRDVLLHPAHLRAYTLMVALVTATFTIIPFLSIYLVNNVGRSMNELPYVWLCGGGATLLTTTPVGFIADRWGKLLVFRAVALFCLVPILLITNLPPTSLAVTLLATTLFMVATSARMVPAMAMITASAAPRYRGSFMSINSSVQQMAMGAAPLLSGLILGAEPEGQSALPLQGYPLVGLLASAAMLASIFLAGRLRPGGDSQSQPAPAVAEAAA
jgi:predicted MFS family arabinose efflux permease